MNLLLLLFYVECQLTSNHKSTLLCPVFYPLGNSEILGRTYSTAWSIRALPQALRPSRASFYQTHQTSSCKKDIASSTQRSARKSASNQWWNVQWLAALTRLLVTTVVIVVICMTALSRAAHANLYKIATHCIDAVSYLGFAHVCKPVRVCC